MKKMQKLNRIQESTLKYRAKMRKSGKKWIVKGMLFSTIMLGGTLLFEDSIAEASEWQANTVETIKAKLVEGQNSYTFEDGDTFYNIGLAVNVRWQTLMEINGFEAGSQYTVPVGTTITFDGAKVTVTDKDGQIVNEKVLTNEDKIDPSKTFANQSSDSPSTGNSSTNNRGKVDDTTSANYSASGNKAGVTNNPSKPETNREKDKQVQKPEEPTTNDDAQKQKEEAERAKAEAEKAKQEAEKAKQEAERQKQEAEKRLTDALNAENSNTLADLQAKRATATQNVANAQASYDAESAKLPALDQQIATAQASQANAQAAVNAAQGAVTTAQAGVNDATARISALQSQIAALQGQATESGDESAQTQLTALQGQLAAAQGDLNTYNGQLATAQGQLDATSAQLATATASLNDASSQRAGVEASIASAQAALTAAQNEFNNLPTNVEASNSEAAKKIQAELAEWNKKIADLNNQIASLDNQISDLANTIAALDEQVSNAGTEFDQVESDANDTKDSVADDSAIGNANDTVTDVENNIPDVKPAPTNEDKYVTINVDEAGNTLSDVTGYVKVSESEAVKTVETLPNGDTITTYTTTVTYHKVVNEDKHVTVMVDTDGNELSDTNGYIKVSEEQLDPVVETLPNGDTVTTYTTREVYRKLANTERHDVINVDEDGKTLSDLTGYVKVLESEPVITTETAENGDTITVYTVTVTYHKIANEDKHVTINVDTEGNELSDLTGYVKVSEEDLNPVVETLANGDTVTTYTKRVTYRKVQNIDKHVTVNVDTDGKTLSDTTGYEKVSESEPVKTVETLPNGDTVTTYTTTVTYKKVQKDEIIENIKGANDSDIKKIKDQVVKDDTGVSIEQADKLTNVDLSKQIGDQFIEMVQKEQQRYGEDQVNLTKDDAAYREIASRAVEVMYNTSHELPSNTLEDGTYTIDREPGSQEMMFNTENIAKFTISKSKVNGDSAILAKLIAETMFESFVADERDAYRDGAAGEYMHYQNIIASGYSDMALSVFMVDNGSYYTISVAVTTGKTTTVR